MTTQNAMRIALFVLAASSMSAAARQATAHCQVPCGIYGDERRFQEMLEDTETITKAIAQIGELSGTHDANGHNQLARWVSTKEDHASNVQEIIAQYFMAQRIKADDPEYGKKLKAAHAVIVAAMKTKQSAEPASAETLKKAILDLYRAYEGREPNFSHVEAPVKAKAA
ncbi:superoxide dismutase, Ni [Pseudobythopirellula maris]|nr:superoxide dismutase, Ni [Pseudobythopirellula maris]